MQDKSKYKSVSQMYMAGSFSFTFNSNHEILILRENSENPKYSWDMPGGTLENEETPIEGVRREVYEETNLSINIIYPACFLKWDRHESGYPILVSFYLAETESENIQLSIEHSSYRWVSRKILEEENINLPPGKEIVDAAFDLYESIRK